MSLSIRDWKEKFQDKAVAYDQLQKEFSEFQDDSRDLEEALEHEISEVRVEKKKLEDVMVTKKNEVENLKTQFSSKSAKNANSQRQISTLVDQIHGYREGLDVVSSKHRKLEQINDDHERMRRILTAKENQLENRLEEALENSAFVETEFEDFKSNASETIQRLHEELRDLKSDLNVAVYHFPKSTSCDDTEIKSAIKERDQLLELLEKQKAKERKEHEERICAEQAAAEAKIRADEAELKRLETLKEHDEKLARAHVEHEILKSRLIDTQLKTLSGGPLIEIQRRMTPPTGFKEVREEVTTAPAPSPSKKLRDERLSEILEEQDVIRALLQAELERQKIQQEAKYRANQKELRADQDCHRSKEETHRLLEEQRILLEKALEEKNSLEKSFQDHMRLGELAIQHIQEETQNQIKKEQEKAETHAKTAEHLNATISSLKKEVVLLKELYVTPTQRTRGYQKTCEIDHVFLPIQMGKLDEQITQNYSLQNKIRVYLLSGSYLFDYSPTNSYCVFKSIDQHGSVVETHRSSVCHNSTNPIWKSLFSDWKYFSKMNSLVVEVWNWRRFSWDDFMGSFEVSRSKMDGTVQKIELLNKKFKPPSKKDKINGRITIKVCEN